MNRVSFLMLFSCMLMIGALSCISRTYVIVEPSTASLKRYNFLEVKDFESALDERTALEIAQLLPEIIVNELYSYNVTNPDARLLFPVRSTKENENVLILSGILISHEKRSRSKERSGDPKKGKDFYVVRCTFSDKKTGDVILQSHFEAKLAGGFLGENTEETARDIAKAIVFYLEAHF